MLALSPADAKLTKELVRLLSDRDMSGAAMSLKPAEMAGPLDTLKGLAMVGQWTMPYVGVPGSALSGRQLIQLLCKRNGRPFVTYTL